MPGAGPPITVDIDHPLPVEIAICQMPEPGVIWHHISVFPSPFKSPVRHWSLTRRLFVPQMGAGPFQVAVDQPLPVESPTDQLPARGKVSHQKSAIPSPLRSPVKHRSATDVAGAGPSQDDVDQPTCAAVFETEENTMKTESSSSGIRRLARAAACAFRANPEKSALFSVIIGWQ